MLFKKNDGANFLVVGLGNPGKKYDDTRHNIGFEAIDYIASNTQTKIIKAKFSSLYGTWQYNDKKIILLKPQTFMNLSGQAVKQAADFYKIQPENIIIIYDDISLSVGKMRIRAKGSAGGHNGIKSIISYCGEKFPRVKIGVGEKPSPEYDLANWVLGKFSSQDKIILNDQFNNILDAIKLIVDDDMAKAMNLYNQ